MRLNEQELDLIELSLKAVKKNAICDGMCQFCFNKDCDIPEQADALLKRIEEIR